MRLNNNQQAFLALVGAGLWEKDVQLSPFGDTDYGDVYCIAGEQSVIGLVAAGIEHVVDIRIPQEYVLQFVGHALQLEQRNLAMNRFLTNLIEKLREEDVCAVLVKGQGIAQCYERPLWRACGDIDFLLDDNNYLFTKNFLRPLASSIGSENVERKHFDLTINSWQVELHGTLKGGLWKRLEDTLDEILTCSFVRREKRVWRNVETDVILPSVDNDVIIVFSHILQHLFNGGIGLRQICDWCRLLWTYKDTIDHRLLEDRLKKMDMVSEWRTFASFSVNYLGIPSNVIPLYDTESRWNRKSKRLLLLIMESGNFGHNRNLTFLSNCPLVLRKFLSFTINTYDSIRIAVVFPKHSLQVWGGMVRRGFNNI